MHILYMPWKLILTNWKFILTNFFYTTKINTIQEYNETFTANLLMTNKYLGNFVLFLPTKIFISFLLTRGLLDYTSERNAHFL